MAHRAIHFSSRNDLIPYVFHVGPFILPPTVNECLPLPEKEGVECLTDRKNRQHNFDSRMFYDDELFPCGLVNLKCLTASILLSQFNPATILLFL